VNRAGRLWWVGVVAVVVAAGFVLGRGRSTGPPLDPTSTDELGTRALVELLGRFGAKVTRDLPVAGDDTDAALLLQDRLDDRARDRLSDWAVAGGVLVVADPSSPLAPEIVDVVPGDTLAAGTCTVGTVAELDRVEAETFVRYAVGADDSSCFGTGDRAWLVARPRGEGSVVALGGAAPLVNANLDESDNAAVVTALLAPRAGATIAVVYEAVATQGERALSDLIPDRVWWALGQLVVAFGLYVVWRAGRFGRPVPDPQPVEVPGSLLVEARGQLYRRSASATGVDARLRAEAERRLRQHLAVPPDDPLPLTEVASRAGGSEDRVARLFLPLDRPGRAGDLRRRGVDLDELVRRVEAAPAPPVPGGARLPGSTSQVPERGGHP
jgi:hypothetical protein